MNEFEWRRQMQNLRQPVAPRRDLWAGIESALEDVDGAVQAPAPADRRAARLPRWLAVASVAMVMLVCASAGWHLSRTPQATRVARTTPWKPVDPRLAGAAIELDAARMELQQAMLQAPDSPALQRLLARTERQQTQLHQLGGQPG